MTARILTRESIAKSAPQADMSPSCSESDIVLSPHAALLTLEDGTTVLVDMSGEFYGLSETAGVLLRACLEHGRDAAIAQIAEDYGAPATVVAEDLDALVANVLRAGALERRDQPRKDRVRRAIGGLMSRAAACAMRLARTPARQAAIAVTMTRLSFALAGWNATLAGWLACFARPADCKPGEDEAATIDETVRAAAARNWLGVDCKERALACLALARTRGLDARLNIGVAPYPLSGHCWCTLEGNTVVGDEQDRYRSFIPVFAYA